MSGWADVWKQVDAMAARSHGEVAQTRAIIEDQFMTGGKWKFVRVDEGVTWIARHRMHGEARATSSKSLIAEVKRLCAADLEKREREQQKAVPR